RGQAGGGCPARSGGRPACPDGGPDDRRGEQLGQADPPGGDRGRAARRDPTVSSLRLAAIPDGRRGASGRGQVRLGGRGPGGLPAAPGRVQGESPAGDGRARRDGRRPGPVGPPGGRDCPQPAQVGTVSTSEQWRVGGGQLRQQTKSRGVDPRGSLLSALKDRGTTFILLTIHPLHSTAHCPYSVHKTDVGCCRNPPGAGNMLTGKTPRNGSIR